MKEAPEARELPVPSGVRAQGPWDRSEKAAEATAGYFDFGAFMVRPIAGMQIQVASDATTNLAVLISLGDSAVELRASAATRHGDDWADVLHEIRAEVSARGGDPVERAGAFGREVLTHFPAQDHEGNDVNQPACFVGIQGPRWLLRATVVGPSAVNLEESSDLLDVIRSVVVVRGPEARMLGEALPIEVPEQMQDVESA